MDKTILQESIENLWTLITSKYSSRDNEKIHEVLSFFYSKNPLLKFLELTNIFSHTNKKVLLATGFPIYRKLKPETDGPLGTMALAKVFDSLGYSIEIVTDRIYMPIIESLLSLLKLRVKMIHILPPKTNLTENKIYAMINPASFDIAIAIEAPAPNIVGIYHNMHGFNITPIAGDFGRLFELLNSSGVFTIGIGDGGNEIGMGKIRKILYEKDIVPFGRVCRCPCKKGILSAIETDYLLSATTSNLGAYALSAILASKFNLEFFPTPDDEERMLRVAIESGAIDGITEKPELMVDGITCDTLKKVIRKTKSSYIDLKSALEP